MPQFPIQPWPPRAENEPPARRRRTRLDADNPRYAHLPLVQGTSEGDIQVLRGDTGLSDRLAARPEPQRLFSPENGSVPHLVTWNRLDQLAIIATGRLVAVGQVEFRLCAAPYRLSSEVSQARTFEELRTAFRAELDHLDGLEADGWELFTDRTAGIQLLVDTRRPDEHLTARDLP